MKIIETCPKCGADLIDSVLTTNPPRARKECSKCDWEWIEESEDIIRIPFVPPKKHSWPIEWVKPADDPVPACCRHCGNHPSNGGSGICHCVLPYMTYTGGNEWMITTSSTGEYMFGAGDHSG